jgi:small neutral amino acid transporter SnatA (MarC family)
VTPIARRLTVTAGLTLGAGALVFTAAAPPESCPDITPEATRAAAGSAVGWLVDNQNDDGTWLYEYDRGTDTVSDDYNEVRHAGVMTSLYQAAARGYDGALESADRGLAWALDSTVERNGWIGLTDSDAVQAGSNALLLSALVERRLLTGDDRYDDIMVGLATFLTDQTEPSGALLAYYDLEPDQPRAGVYSIYYTGEAYWALGRIHRAFPDAGWGEFADRMGAYMATVRDDVEDIWPPLADHWSGYGLAETATFPDREPGEPFTEEELEFIRRQGGLMGQRVRSISQRFGPWGVAVRGTFTPRGGGYGVFGEGLTGLWRAAQADERLAPERNDLAERATCIAGLSMKAQSDADDAATYPDPQKVEGAWFIDDVTRMDDQQHALSALLMTIPILESVPEPASSGHSAPMWLLWFVVVIATINPVRITWGAPRREPTERVAVIAMGTLLGGAALLAVGSLSGWLIDALDTSRPAVRLGAAALCMLATAIDLIRPRPPSDDDLPGLRASIFPVAIPLMIRPAIIVAGVSVVADHSSGLYALALLATAVAATALAPVAPRDGIPDRLLGWGVRVLAAAGFVCGAILVAHAVFDL